MEAGKYRTIAAATTGDFRDRGSKFLAYAYPIEGADDVKHYVQLLKKEHPKAVHHCFAWRLGTNAFNYRANDDGEPSGSAGKPILGQIDSMSITNVLVVVVRYFGGTLLGVPGLINAYKTATALALQLSPIIKKPIEIPYELNFDYHQMNEVMMLVKHYNCSVVEQTAQLFIQLHIGIPKNRLDEVLEKLGTLREVSFKTTLKLD
jgi:uncharacterized YigZ family protein